MSLLARSCAALAVTALAAGVVTVAPAGVAAASPDGASAFGTTEQQPGPATRSGASKADDTPKRTPRGAAPRTGWSFTPKPVTSIGVGGMCGGGIPGCADCKCFK